jgi:hypothetical protein
MVELTLFLYIALLSNLKAQNSMPVFILKSFKSFNQVNHGSDIYYRGSFAQTRFSGKLMLIVSCYRRTPSSIIGEHLLLLLENTFYDDGRTCSTVTGEGNPGFSKNFVVRLSFNQPTDRHPIYQWMARQPQWPSMSVYRHLSCICLN